MLIAQQHRPWWILVAASSVLGLVVLDETVVGVALPTIRADLNMSVVASHWVVNAYLLTFSAFLAVGGRLGDMLGRRITFPAGATLFMAGSALAAVAPSGGWLVAARAIQGIGAAVTFPASMAIVSAAFPPHRQGSAFGVQTTIAGCFMASGPLVGGFLSQVVSWRWIFAINLPIIAITVGVLLALLESPRTPANWTQLRPNRFDYPGLLTLVGGLTGITIGLMQSADWGWSSAGVLGGLIGGTALLVLFVVIELHRPTPLVELDLLANPTFTGGNIVFAVFQFEKMVVFVFVALYLQQRLGESPVAAGLVVSAAIVPTLITSRLAGVVRDRHGPRVPLTVTLLTTAATLLVVGMATVIGNVPLLIAALLVWGAIMPFIAVTTRPAVMGAVPAAKHGQASGVNLSIQMFGGTLAIAVSSPLLVMTGAFWPVFAATATVTLLAAAVAWRTIAPISAPSENPSD